MIKLKTDTIFRIWSVIGVLCINILLISLSFDIFIIFVIDFLLIVFESAFGFLKYKITPYIFFISSPLLLINYFTREDFLIRLFLLIMLSYFSAFLIEEYKLKAILPRIDYKSVYIVFVIFLFLLSFIFYYKKIYFSGDEPHYLIIAQSIVEDGDFNLENNYKNKTYLKFHPTKLEPHAYKHNNKLLSFHLPGVAFLLTPFYFIYKFINYSIPPTLFFRLSISIINGFLALFLYLIFDFFIKNKKNNQFFIFMLIIFPISIHSIHLYPEIPAAILLMAAIYFGILKSNDLLFGLFISFIPWFHIKYLSVVLIVISFYFYKKLKQKNIKFILPFLFFPLINLVLFIIFMLSQYGFLNPMKIFPSGNYFKIPLIQMVETFIAFFLDQRDGLLFYSPVYFLFFYTVFKIKSINRKYKTLFLLILLFYLVFHSITTIRGAYAPSARPLAFVIWVMLLFIVIYYSENGENTFLSKFTIGMTIFFNLIIFYFPLFIYQPVISSTTTRYSALFNFLGSENIRLYKLFPSFLKTDNSGYYINYFWIGLIVFIILNSKFNFLKLRLNKQKTVFLSVPIFLILFLLFSYYPHVYRGNYWKGENFDFYVNSKNFIKITDKKFRLKTNEKFILLFDSNKVKKKNLKFTFFPANKSNFFININSGRKKIFSGVNYKKRLKINILSLGKVNIEKNKYYYLSIKIYSKDIPAIYLKGL